ncbi:MAG: response regulator [Elusimicrobiota bacterium]
MTKIKVLIVDDEPAMRTILGAIIGDMGYDVMEAGDAKSGFSVAMSQRPELILSDFMMPGEPGKTIFGELASHSETKNIPIIVISGFSKEKIQSYLPQHLWPFIMGKPVDLLRLEGVIADCLKKKAESPGWFSSLFA